MNCQQVDEHIFSYIDSKLAPSLSSDLESHIAHCEDCRAKLDFARMETDILCNELFMPTLHDTFTADVMAAVGNNQMIGPTELAATRNHRAWYTRTPFWLVATAAAFVLLVYTISPDFLAPDTKIANQQSKDLKVAERNVASNAVIGGETTKKLKQDSQNESMQDEVSIDEPSSFYLPAETAIDETGNQVRTLAGAVPDEVNNELMKQRQSSPDRDRNDASVLKAPISSTMPKVINMPASFEIVNSAKQTDGWTFTYEGDGKQLTVSLASANVPMAMIVKPEAAATDSSACVGAACEYVVNKKSAVNSVNRSVVIDNVNYELILTGELSVEELQALAERLIIEK